MRDARLIVDPDWDACCGQRLDPARTATRCGLVRDQPDIDPALRSGIVEALTRISLSALSIGRTAKAAQSSSGAKQTATAAPDETEAASCIGESTPKERARARCNTHYGIHDIIG